MSDDFEKWMPREFPANDKPGEVNYVTEMPPPVVAVDPAGGPDETVHAVVRGGKLIRTFDCKVLGMTSFRGRIIVATEDGVYEYNPDTDTMDQIPMRRMPTNAELRKACDAYQYTHDCNICGGRVDLRYAKKPTVSFGKGRKP